MPLARQAIQNAPTHLLHRLSRNVRIEILLQSKIFQFHREIIALECNSRLIEPDVVPFHTLSLFL